MKQSKPRDVTAVRSLYSLIEEGWSFGLNADPPVVQEHADGTWTVHYPEEGFIKTKPNEVWPMTTSAWPGATGDSPRDLEAACKHALVITGQEPKVERLSDKYRKTLATREARAA